MFGIGVYVLYRRHQGLDLTTTTKVVVPRPVVEHEAEYESVLVAFDVGNFNRSTVATAARLAARRRRGIHILVTITVPNSSPIDAELPDQEMTAQGIIEQARVHFGRRVSGRWTKVRAGPGGPRHRRGGEADPRARDRHAAAAPHGHHARSARRSRPSSPSGPRASSSRPVPPTGPVSALRSPVVPDPRDVHRAATRILSAIMVVIGVLLLVLTFAGGGGPVSLGTILGVLFLLAGIMRLRLERSPR